MMEKERLQELYDFKILDAEPEKELDELAEIASAICDTPISLVSFIDEDRQWFMANRGLALKQTHRNHSFCQHTLQKPKEVLVVDDPVNDDRFKENPLVLGTPKIRFYAGAPLETASGNVLGTLCIIDDKPREISANQKNALMLLAKKAMDFLITRKLLLEQKHSIENSALLLKKLTDEAPGVIYQLEMLSESNMVFSFVSKGVTELHPSINPEALKENPELAFDFIHPDDAQAVKKSLQESFVNLTDWSIEYRIVLENDLISWHWVNARPEIRDDGAVVWYGTIQNITERKDYIKTLEQILFDISHIMRRPVATLLGLSALLDRAAVDEKVYKNVIGYIKTVAQEMDQYLRQLNENYYQRKMKVNSEQKGR